MKTKQLLDHMEGSFLKEQYLEAFLVQSAYIESLLKSYTSFNFFLEIKGILDKKDNSVTEVFYRKVDRYSLYELGNVLFEAGHINKNQKRILDEYREKRNKIVHDLLMKMKNGRFEEELKDTYMSGENILNNPKFKRMAQLQQNYEENKSDKN